MRSTTIKATSNSPRAGVGSRCNLYLRMEDLLTGRDSAGMHGQRLSTDYADNHRKLILCALNRNNTEGARQIFHEMPGSARNETMTRYLVYKVALQSGDHDLAADCLERIGAGAAQDPNYLYACVLDAQRARDKICAGQAMKQLLERHEFNEDSPIHLPALLRSNIRIAVAAVEGEKSSARNACIEDVAGLFEQGMHFFSALELARLTL